MPISVAKKAAVVVAASNIAAILFTRLVSKQCCCALRNNSINFCRKVSTGSIIRLSSSSSLNKRTEERKRRWGQTKLFSLDHNIGVNETTERIRKGGVSMNEINLRMDDGMHIQGQHFFYTAMANNCNNEEQDRLNNKAATKARNYQQQPSLKILALHGWLDNCRSFHYLAPRLIERFEGNAELVAVDLPGHGWSSHRSIDGPLTVLSEGAYYVAEILHKLGWDNENNDNNSGEKQKNSSSDKVALLGHSMGGGMAITYGGIFPNQISHAILIDIYGPEPKKESNTAASIRNHVTQRRSSGPNGRRHIFYPTLERCIQARQKSAVGNQYISLQAATEIATRATVAVKKNKNHTYNDDRDDCGGDPLGYKFRHDTRLLWPSLQYFSRDQIKYIMKEVTCHVCIIKAEDGYPFSKERIDDAIQNLNPTVHKVLPGSHHLHADPETADAVLDTIYDFLKQRQH